TAGFGDAVGLRDGHTVNVCLDPDAARRGLLRPSTVRGRLPLKWRDPPGPPGETDPHDRTLPAQPAVPVEPVPSEPPGPDAAVSRPRRLDLRRERPASAPASHGPELLSPSPFAASVTPRSRPRARAGRADGRR